MVQKAAYWWYYHLKILGIYTADTEKDRKIKVSESRLNSGFCIFIL